MINKINDGMQALFISHAAQLRQQLTEAAHLHKQASEKMWTCVFECLGV